VSGTIFAGGLGRVLGGRKDGLRPRASLAFRLDARDSAGRQAVLALAWRLLPKRRAMSEARARTALPPADADRTLVAALLADDAAAWREFRRRYDRLALSCIRKATARFAAVSSDDVRDIHGQWCLSLLVCHKAKLRAFDPARGARLSTYVGMLARHCAYDWLGVRRREPHREDLACAAALPGLVPDPFDAALQNERAAVASRLLRVFSARDQEFAALYFAGTDAHDIARLMRVSVKSVYSKKHKIQARLESIVAREQDGATGDAMP
jgi:RNA polymerase sigma-70 factor (ECF subfamily)